MTMYGAAKIYQDFNHRYPPRADALILVSKSKTECEEYIKAHRREFLEMHGYCFPAVIKFDTKKCPKTMRYLRESPQLHIAASEEDEYLASCMIGR